MIKRKICMLGTFSVGKTSLVSQFVRSIFSDKYHTTVGVKVDKKELSVDGRDMNMLVWDIQGEDDLHRLCLNYLRGAAGYLLVADGTRRDTLEAAANINREVKDFLGNVPFVVLLNKADLEKAWEIPEETLASFRDKGWRILKTSAKTGAGVEEAFTMLARDFLAED